MINIYSAHPTSSFVMYPDDPITSSGAQQYRLELTQSLDQSTSSIFTVQRLNTEQPQRTSEVLVMSAYSGSEIPTADGQYTASLRLGSGRSLKWGTAHKLFGTYHVRWSEVDPDSYVGDIIASDRAYVHGTNLQDITTYTGTDQTGAYTTYNG